MKHITYKILGVAMLALSHLPAYAQDMSHGMSSMSSPTQTSSYKDVMLGNAWGARNYLSKKGISFNLQDMNEYFGNTSGGRQTGSAYDGMTQATIQMDTKKSFGFSGGTFNISALNIRGINLTTKNLLGLEPITNIQANNTTRLWELWYQQKLPITGNIDIRIGQQSLDQEFITSQNAHTFIKNSFWWPTASLLDMPGNGPDYPLSALGLRVRAEPTKNWSFLAGVFNGTPVGNSTNPDPQKGNLNGVNFALGNGYLAIAEAQYHSGAGTQKAGGLSGTYKLGIWYDSEKFADQADLEDPAMHQGNYSIYAVVDQMLWHSKKYNSRSVNFFTTLVGTSLDDRNPINFSMNAGLTMHAPFASRKQDTAGIAMGYAHISPSASDRDRAMNNLGIPTIIRDGETFIEATYQAQITPWWQIQPDLQYVFNPSGGVNNPDSDTRIGDELILGIRSMMMF